MCVVPGSPRDYRDAHPTRPAIIVEAAESGLRIARGRKACAYARAGITDYWIVNPVDRVLEVSRDPVALDERTRRPRYPSIRTLVAGDEIAPLAAPDARIRVADVLP